jgi:hypothetical protein
MRVSIKVSVPSSNEHPSRVSGQLIAGLSGTRNDRDFVGDPLALDGATTEQGAAVDMPEGSLFVVVVKRTKRPACDLRVLFRADGRHGEAALDPGEQTRVATLGASVVVAARPESKWGASWEPIVAALEGIVPVSRKRNPGPQTRGTEQYPNMGPLQYRCPDCDRGIDRRSESGHAPDCTFRAPPPGDR